MNIESIRYFVTTANSETISEAAIRVSFAGPLAGAAAAQQAAKLNGAPSNEDFTDFVRERALVARRGYGANLGGEDALPEPWPGAWDEYASMLGALADEGVAAGIDNASFFDDPAGGHVLLDQGFYAAVLGRSWCWFHWSAPTLLDDYSGWGWWPPSTWSSMTTRRAAARPCGPRSRPSPSACRPGSPSAAARRWSSATS